MTIVTRLALAVAARLFRYTNAARGVDILMNMKRLFALSLLLLLAAPVIAHAGTHHHHRHHRHHHNA